MQHTHTAPYLYFPFPHCYLVAARPQSMYHCGAHNAMLGCLPLSNNTTLVVLCSFHYPLHSCLCVFFFLLLFPRYTLNLCSALSITDRIHGKTSSIFFSTRAPRPNVVHYCFCFTATQTVTDFSKLRYATSEWVNESTDPIRNCTRRLIPYPQRPKPLLPI